MKNLLIAEKYSLKTRISILDYLFFTASGIFEQNQRYPSSNAITFHTGPILQGLHSRYIYQQEFNYLSQGTLCSGGAMGNVEVRNVPACVCNLIFRSYCTSMQIGLW